MVLRTQLSEPESRTKNDKPAGIIARYLDQQDKTFLVSLLTDIINSDKNLRQLWLIQAEQALGCLDKKTIRKRITAAIPYNRNYYKFHQVRQYFEAVEDALTMLKEPIANLPGDEQIELVDYAMERIVKAQDTVDDSGGFRFDSQALLQAMHQNAFTVVKWSDNKKARYLVDTMITDGYRMHGDIPDSYTDIISDDCLKHFYRIVQKQWDALPRLTSDDWDEKEQYSSLLSILEAEAKKNNDYETLISLNLKVAQADYDYLKLIEWSLELNDFERAQQFIDRAQQCEKKYRASDIAAIQQTLWLKTGKGQKALDKQWVLFQKNQRFSDYQKLKSMAKELGDTSDWFKTCIEFLNTLPKPTASRPFMFRDKNGLIMKIYLEEGAVEEAYQLLSESPSIHPALLHQLAKALGTDLKRASPIYVQMARQSINESNNNAYHEGIALLKELNGLSDSPEHQQTMSTILQEMRLEFKIKRNFIKWLNEAFPLKASVRSSGLTIPQQ